MKRIFTLAVVLMGLTIGAQAQGIKFGAKGGLNITDMSFSEKVFDSENKTGFFIGPTMQVTLPIGGLGVDIAAMYDQKESKVNDQSIKQQSIIVPVNLRLKLGLGKTAGIYAAVGPQFGFNIGDDEFKWKKDNVENTFQLKKSYLSVNLGAGVYLFSHLEIGFAYNIGISKTGEAGWTSFRDGALHPNTEDDTKAKTWTISAAYYF